MKIKIRECPFCGNDPIQTVQHFHGTRLVACDKCWTRGPDVSRSDFTSEVEAEEEAIKLWNSRK